MAREGRPERSAAPDGQRGGGPAAAIQRWMERDPEVALDRSPGWHLHIPNEPVDPWDCRRWPNSPFCQQDPEIPPVIPQSSLIPGSPIIRDRIDRLRPNLFEIGDFGFNNCEQWICVSPTIGGWSLPPICINHRAIGCRDPQEEPDPDTPPPPTPAGEPAQPVFVPNNSAEGWIVGCKYMVFIHDPKENLGVPGAARDIFGYGLPGYCIPAYGPIAGLVVTDYGDGLIKFALVCGGLGMLPRNSVPDGYAIPFERGLATVSTGAFGTNFWQLVFERTRAGEASPRNTSFHTPLLSGNVASEIWTRGYGRRFELTPDRQRVTIGHHPGELHTYTIGYAALQFGGVPIPPSISLHSVRRAADLPQTLGFAWGQPCAAPTIPPPIPSAGGDSMAGCSCRDIERMIDAKLRRVYQILGFSAALGEKIQVNPESLVKALGGEVYDNFDQTKEVEVENIPQLQAAIASALFYRGGLHRLPATVPSQLAQEDNLLNLLDRTTKIQDAMSWNEWEIKQIDGLLGSFPTVIKYKNAEGEEQQVKLPNVSEALAEVVGILLSLNADTDVLISLAFKSVLEAIGARIAATTATDYAAANAEYLGYRTKQERRSVKVSINTGTNNVQEALQEATRQVPKIKFDGKTDHQEQLDKILVVCQILKEVFYKTWSAGDELPGDRIKEDRQGEGGDDAGWDAFITATENPPSGQAPPNAVKPDIRNIVTPPEGSS